MELSTVSPLQALPLHGLSVGDRILVYWSDDRRWHPAEITAAMGDDECEVLYEDVGECEQIRLDKARFIPSRRRGRPARKSAKADDEATTQSSAAPSRSRFFRILMPGFTKRLMIPKAFAKQMMQEECTTARATLVNPNGQAWLVDIRKARESFYFEGDGWTKLVDAHNLQLGYFLVFSCKADMAFKFRAYDLKTCEISNYPSDAGNVTDNVVTKAKGRNTNLRTKQFVVTVGGYCLSKPLQRVPVGFARGNKSLTEKTDVVLKDPSGRCWPVKLVYNERAAKRGSGMHLGGGWVNFARSNELKVGDRCVFRFLKGEEDVLNVKILRN